MNKRQHENVPDVCCDPVICLTSAPHGMHRVEAYRYPGARPETWLGSCAAVAIRFAGECLRDWLGCRNAVLCVEWPVDSVAHEEPRLRPNVELRRFWAHVASPRVRGSDTTTACEMQLDYLAPDHTWPSGMRGAKYAVELSQ